MAQEHSEEMKIPIICIHKVGPIRGKFWITKEMLFSQVQLLTSLGYNFTTCAALADGTYPKNNPCILTFDDAYENFLTEAMPVLRRFNAPATVFVPTGFVGGDNSGWERFDITPVKHLDYQQIRACQREGIDFQPHGVSHTNFLKLSLPEQQHEAYTSKLELENVLARKCEVFCYPGGGHTDETKEMLKSIGYKMSMSCERGVEDLTTIDPFAVKRLSCYSEIV